MPLPSSCSGYRSAFGWRSARRSLRTGTMHLGARRELGPRRPRHDRQRRLLHHADMVCSWLVLQRLEGQARRSRPTRAHRRGVEFGRSEGRMREACGGGQMIAPSYFEYQERRTQRSNAHDLIEFPDIIVTESELPEPSTCTAAGSSSAPAESQKDFERI